MEKEIYMSDVIGVSAGACNALDYVSRQPGRTRDCMIPDEQYGKIYLWDQGYDPYKEHDEYGFDL